MDIIYRRTQILCSECRSKPCTCELEEIQVYEWADFKRVTKSAFRVIKKKLSWKDVIYSIPHQDIDSDQKLISFLDQTYQEPKFKEHETGF